MVLVFGVVLLLRFGLFVYGGSLYAEDEEDHRGDAGGAQHLPAGREAALGGKARTHYGGVKRLAEIHAGHQRGGYRAELLRAENGLTDDAGDARAERVCKRTADDRQDENDCRRGDAEDDEEYHAQRERDAYDDGEHGRAYLGESAADAEHHEARENGVYSVPVGGLRGGEAVHRPPRRGVDQPCRAFAAAQKQGDGKEPEGRGLY